MKVFSKALLFIVALTALLAALAWLIPAERRAELLSALPTLQSKVIKRAPTETAANNDAETPSRIQLVNGLPAVSLTAQEQRLSGIRMARLKRINYRAEREAYGEVMDIQPLLKLRGQYVEAQAQQKMATARLQVSAQVYERLRGLNTQGDIISASRMRQAQFRWQIDQAQLAAAKMRVRNIYAQSAQMWGQELTNEALNHNSDQIERLINRANVLLRITLTPGQHLPKATHTAFIDSDGDRRRARAASLISAAPQTDAASQGETWFFWMATGDLRTGMRVAAWIPWDKAPAVGVLVPDSAVVWYGGRPWVWVDAGKALFARRAVPVVNEIAGGWVAREGFKLGEGVVVSGGQTLLSEEFRSQIPEEQDD
jgi:hypothetical protein